MKWHEPRPLCAVLLLVAVTLACLLPFLAKAFHIDDPLFLWTARHIQSHPLDFYGFQVNWRGTPMPVPSVMFNPPLTAYYLAVAAAVLGWGEAPLHIAFLFPAVAAVIGTYFLARRLCAFAFAAALATLAAPCFLVCGTSLMCDMMMTAFWVWAVFLWMKGLEQNDFALLALASLLVTACGLVKYFGVCLIPLLLVYSLWKHRGVGRWLLCLCAPALVMGAYEILTRKWYGAGLLATAATNASTQRIAGGLDSKVLTGLAFVGGCLFPSIAAVPLAFGKKALGAALAGLAAIGGVLALRSHVGVFQLNEGGHFKWLFAAQMAVYVWGGALVLFLAVTDFLKYRNADSLLLLLWTFGTFLFATCVNWGVAGRNILPMAPVAALLLIRRLEIRQPASGAGPIRYLWFPLSVSLAVSLLAAWADWSFASSARTAATEITRELKPQSRVIAFEGHWGFQYYMEQLGAKPLDKDHLEAASNGVVVVPLGNSYLFPLPRDSVAGVHTYRFPAGRGFVLMDKSVGAGFFSDGWGPLPFALQSAPIQEYTAFRMK